MQADSRVEGKGFEGVPRHGAGEVAANEVILLACGLALVNDIGSACNVDDCAGESLIEGHGRIAEALDATLVTESFLQAESQADRRVFDRVVHVHVGVAAGLDLQVDE